MKPINPRLLSRKRSVLAALILSLALAGSALAVSEHAYQVTGPVTAVSDTSITIQKGNAPWTVARDANTKITGDPKVGSKVTVKYHMVADTVATK